jgi:hypothetical protein
MTTFWATMLLQVQTLKRQDFVQLFQNFAKYRPDPDFFPDAE